MSELLEPVRHSFTMWLIALCSVAALAAALERVFALWRFGERSRRLADAVSRALLRGDLEDARAQCERASVATADVFLAGLVASASGRAGRPVPSEKIDAAVDRERQAVNLKLRAHLWILGTIGAIAPFIGLFGTVVGIMQAFQQMARTGQGGFTVVASGISEALITTAGGIAVAIEAVVLYNVLNTHAGKLTVKLRLLTEELLEVLHESREHEADALRPLPGATSRAGGEGG